MPDKRNHHFLPRCYLKGFASEDDAHHVWEYQRGRSYAPGPVSRAKYNPVLISLRKAGAALGEYACPRADGTIDFNTYEDALERLEKPADSVFNRIRNLQPIDDSDRDILAAYMVMMIKRVPARKELIRDKFPEVLEKQWELITSEIEEVRAQVDPTDETGLATISAKLEACHKIIEIYRQNGMPREMELKTMVESPMPRVMDAIKSMRWQFVVAPNNDSFVTGDNPVHIFKGGVGLSKPYSEVTFPVSSKVALLGTFRDVTQGYLTASDQLLKEINRRIIATSTTYVYGSGKWPWVITVMDKEIHEFNFIYPAPELLSRIRV